ncbi:MAG TPA: penicillin acylase family protein [Candidatus Limnocylindrales bacterium]
MRRLAGLGLRVLAVGLAIGIVAVAGLLAWVTVPALPQRSGEIRVPGLDRPVSVMRDDAGIAHIIATTPHDLFLSQGYVHAQERMWQMEIWRRIGSGRLAEVLGQAALDTDRFVRTLDWRGAAAHDLERVSPRTRAALDAYAEGVNAYLADHRGRLGLAFAIAARSPAGYDPEPWTALDSLTFQKLQAWNLGGNLGSEIFRMLADAHLGDPARTDDLFPPYRADAPVITPTELEGSGGAGAPTAAASPAPSTRLTEVARDPAAWRELAAIAADPARVAGLDDATPTADRDGIGSNNWVVGPSLSATGHALLANDPHLGIAMPSVWYMNGLHCRVVDAACPYDVAGVSFPSVPGVVLGHNARIAWGATNVDPDVQDLFLETPDPDHPTRYLFRGESRPYEIRREQIRVKGAETVVMDVRSTIHGPVITDVHPRLEDGPPVALRWTALTEPDGALESILRLNTVSSFEEFRDAFRGFGAPSQNFVYADVDGHIGYVLPGAVPIRAGGGHGDRPVDGASGSHEWTGMIPFDDLPWQLDPPSGLIVSANNAAVDDRYPYFIAAEWDRGDRAQRILDLLAAGETDGITTDEMRAIQTDSTIIRAARIIPGLAGVAPSTDDGRLVLERIRGWQGRTTADDAGCAAYMVFELAALRRIFDDELGDLARDYVGGGSSLDRFTSLLAARDDAWWDDVATPERESAATVLAAALDDAGRELRSTLGAPDGWTWGRLHVGVFRDSTLGTSGIGPIEFLLNHGPVALDGAAGAILNAHPDLSVVYPDPTDPDYVPVGIGHAFEVAVLPSYRLTIDLGDLDAARIVQTTGQSGQPFDRHYGDLIDEWAAGRTVPLPFSTTAVTGSAVTTLNLAP